MSEVTKKKVYRADLINAIQDNLKSEFNQTFSKGTVDNFIVAYNNVLQDFFLDNKSVQTPLGQFQTYISNPLSKIVPYSGEKVDIPARLKVKFKPSSNLKTNLKEFYVET